VNVHLVDGTYELFRQFYGAARGSKLGPTAGAAGVLASTLQLLEAGATHVAVASDHIIESFRNDLWPGYKTGAGMDPLLTAQIPVFEEALVAMGVTMWAMIEHEADDALASAARVAASDARVERVLICTPDKDLAQCVDADRVVQFDRRKREVIDAAGVVAKFGVLPTSIPDYLALVGDSADGFPGLPGWGAKSASSVVARFGSIDRIPDRSIDWHGVSVRGAERLAQVLAENRDLAMRFRHLATLVDDLPVGEIDDWRWGGPTDGFAAVAQALGAPELAARADRCAEQRAPHT
jgi:5'-3' exonuclease